MMIEAYAPVAPQEPDERIRRWNEQQMTLRSLRDAPFAMIYSFRDINNADAQVRCPSGDNDNLRGEDIQRAYIAHMLGVTLEETRSMSLQELIISASLAMSGSGEAREEARHDLGMTTAEEERKHREEEAEKLNAEAAERREREERREQRAEERSIAMMLLFVLPPELAIMALYPSLTPLATGVLSTANETTRPRRSLVSHLLGFSGPQPRRRNTSRLTLENAAPAPRLRRALQRTAGYMAPQMSPYSSGDE